MFSALVDLRRTLRATIRVCSSWIARVWRDGIPDTLPYAACASPAWSTANVEGVPFDDTACVADRELLFNDTGLRLVFAIKGYVTGLYPPEHTKNAAVVLGIRGPKRSQTHPLRNVGTDMFIYALGDSIHCSQTGIQMQKLAGRLTQLEDVMRRISSTRRGDTINFDHASDAGTITGINDVTRTKAIPDGDFYQAMLSIFIGNSPVDRELESGLLGS